MPRGGARNRSGPPMDPDSGRSDVRRVVLTALPSEGWVGEVPDFPLPGASEREVELWRRVWSTPQACAWAKQAWRHYTVGQYVRWSVKAEAEDAPSGIVPNVIRLADQIGLTPAGLKENGWAIASDELGERRADQEPDEPDEDDPRNRFTVVSDGTGG